MKHWGVRTIGGWLIARAERRKPDFIIGAGRVGEEDYLRRWYLIPRNRFLNIYLHRIGRDDDDRALHDHPWNNLSIILRGGYFEEMPGRAMVRRAGDCVFRRACDAHRLIPFGPIEDGDATICWSLFITGPRIRDWGFHCPQGWVPWRKFTSPENSGEIGPGCGGDA